MLDIKELGKVWPIEKKPVILHDRIRNSGDFSYYYPGKNGDVYFKKRGEKIFIDLERSNRCSVFDIPLSLEINGKGEIQTKISNLGFNFAEKFGIRTSRVGNSFIDIQEHELCKPLEEEIDGEMVQLEFIFRNYLTGSLKKMYDDGIDLYGLNLPDEMKEADTVREKLPEVISKLEDLFGAFTKHCENHGIVMVDTKFEVFINSNGDWVLGDEVFTPESSSLFWKKTLIMVFINQWINKFWEILVLLWYGKININLWLIMDI